MKRLKKLSALLLGVLMAATLLSGCGGKKNTVVILDGEFAEPEIVAEIRERFPDYPIIATGGADDESIRATIRAGANAIIWTPPTNGELFRDVMKNYREGKPHP